MLVFFLSICFCASFLWLSSEKLDQIYTAVICCRLIRISQLKNPSPPLLYVLKNFDSKLANPVFTITLSRCHSNCKVLSCVAVYSTCENYLNFFVNLYYALVHCYSHKLLLPKIADGSQIFLEILSYILQIELNSYVLVSTF